MDSIISCQQALLILQQGIQVVSSSGKQRILFTMQNENIKAVSLQAIYRITQEDFLDLFVHESFMIYNNQTDDGEISKLKDEEYYRWRHK